MLMKLYLGMQQCYLKYYATSINDIKVFFSLMVNITGNIGASNNLN